MATVREISEAAEKQILSEYATFSDESKGRRTYEVPCELRTCFQRDRDRIIHCKAFRRLKHKTQVFLFPESDHYRTRLTHTLEVSQIARTITRALRLNEDLAEAIALGHDLGHTPFGHAGERALNEIYSGGFTHFEQSVRVCEKLERVGEGLNLSYEVLDGILHHTKGQWPSTPEGKIVRLADHIAYINHDIDDAVRAGVIRESDIPKSIVDALGNTKSERIDYLVKSVVSSSVGSDVKLDSQTQIHYDALHEFLFESVYHNPVAKSEETKVLGIIEGIYKYLLKNPQKLVGEYRLIMEREGIERAVVDYISGMTDQYAVSTYSQIYIPKSWEV